jgi:hypothetical protein
MMPANRPVMPGEEAVEFRPLPGQEDDWAEFNYVERSALWYWLGFLPVCYVFEALLILIGMVGYDR